MEIKAIILFYFEYDHYCDLRLCNFVNYYIVTNKQTLNCHEHDLTDMHQFPTFY